MRTTSGTSRGGGRDGEGRGGRSRARAFTLAEALIASVVLSVAVVGVSGVLASASGNSRRMNDDAAAQLLARSLMEEVVARPFAPPLVNDQAGWAQGNKNRATYDNVADYNGYTDSTKSGATNPAKTLGGATIDLGDTGAFTRTVAFEYRNSPAGAAIGTGTGSFGLITVICTGNSGTSTTLHKLVSNTTLTR
jgi:Tfp pilus assembly protein PilV